MGVVEQGAAELVHLGGVIFERLGVSGHGLGLRCEWVVAVAQFSVDRLQRRQVRFGQSLARCQSQAFVSRGLVDERSMSSKTIS